MSDVKDGRRRQTRPPEVFTPRCKDSRARRWGGPNERRAEAAALRERFLEHRTFLWIPLLQPTTHDGGAQRQGPLLSGAVCLGAQRARAQEALHKSKLSVLQTSPAS